MVAAAKKIQAPCPTCKRQQSVDVICEHNHRWENEEANISGSESYRTLQCRGCGTFFFQIESENSEDESLYVDPVTGDYDVDRTIHKQYWPALSKRDKPDWLYELLKIDDTLNSIMEEVYTALNNDLHVLAAIGMRTAFDRASELLGVPANLTFVKKLQRVLDLGKIGRDDHKHLEILTDAGSAAAHRGWHPTLKELGTLLDILEGFLHRAFILDAKVQRVKTKIPPKPVRKKVP